DVVAHFFVYDVMVFTTIFFAQKQFQKIKGFYGIRKNKYLPNFTFSHILMCNGRCKKWQRI
ncbi:MAG: hypothetical protein P8Y08_10050, partial [Desulfobulbaceae bacterium]